MNGGSGHQSRRRGLATVGRRAVIAGAGTSAVASLVPLRRLLAGPASGNGKPRFFTAAQFALVDDLSEMIIPADDHSPGARAAGVATEIDRHLSETIPRIPEHRRLRARWQDGLRLVDAAAQRSHGVAFAAATPEQRHAILAAMAAGEMQPHSPEEIFFVELKAATAFAYYTSEVGLRADMQYKGNAFWDEFQGYDVPPMLKR